MSYAPLSMESGIRTFYPLRLNKMFGLGQTPVESLKVKRPKTCVYSNQDENTSSNRYDCNDNSSYQKY